MRYQLGITPDWFKDIDTGFEVISVIVIFLIAATAYKFYKLTDEERYKWFSASFFLIAISYFFKILTNIIVYNEELGMQTLGKFTYTVQYVHEYYYFEIIGTLAFRFFMLLGLFGLYYIVCKCQDKKSVPIIIVLIFLTTIFSNIQYFAFHIIAALFLGLIVWQYYLNAKLQNKSKNITLRSPIIAFSILLLSQLIFSLLFLTPEAYVVGETVQLIGFLPLLYNYIQLVRGK